MRRIATLVFCCAALVVATPSVASAGTTSTVVTVTPSDLVSTPSTSGQFVVINNGDGTGSVSIADGPGTPPLGLSSLTMSTVDTGSHWTVYNYDWMGTPLSAINSLGYSTYTDNSTTAPALQLEINPGNQAGGIDSTIGYSTLNFEPYVNGTVVPDTWQSWNVLDGKVWGSHLTGAPQSAPVSWSTFLTMYPNATIKYGFGVNVGSGWSTPMTGAVDALTIGTAQGTTIYNFELGAAGNLPFASAGSGAETPGATNCQTSTLGCTVTSSGVAMSVHLGKGTYSSSLTIYWTDYTSNGDGGYCAPALGSSTLVAANGDTLNEIVSGTVCEVGSSSPTASHVFTGEYAITGGTGRFANAAGTGAIVGGDDGNGNSYYSEQGTISY